MMSKTDRTYLHVVPEERSAAQAAGALWDDQLKCLYITPEMSRTGFAQWLADCEGDEQPEIASSTAYVAVASSTCPNCHADIEIICIYCESGTDIDEPLTHFTVSNIWSMNELLSQQLTPWPSFKKTAPTLESDTSFANHCPHCNAVQPDMLLHDEPDAPFFAQLEAPPRAAHLVPLNGLIRLSGDCHFCV